MTRQEFIDYVKNKTCCKGVVTSPKLESTNEAGDKIYKVNVRFIKGNVIEYRDVRYVVILEGQPQEQVFFLEQEPSETNIAPLG